MGGSSQSESASTVSTVTSTRNISDAYNTTLNKVANLSNVGNIAVDTAGLDGTSLPPMSTFLPFAIVGGLALVALIIFRRG